MASNISHNRYSSKINLRQIIPAYEKGKLWKSENTSEISRRNIRERLIQLLAIKPFSKADLYSRLKQEGMRDHERSSIASLLMAIALLCNRMYSLRYHMWYYVNENWPFYTEHERDQVKRNMPKDLTPPHHTTDRSSSGSQSPTDTLTDGPPQQRDSHLVTKTAIIMHSTKKDSLYQIKHITNGTSVMHKSNNDEKSQPTQHQLDFQKNSESQTNSLEYEYHPPPKKQRISHMITKSTTITHSRLRDSTHQVNDITSSNRVVHKSHNDEKSHQQGQPTQHQQDFKKKSDSLTKSASTPKRKKQRMMELFGEDPATPVNKITTESRSSNHTAVNDTTRLTSHISAYKAGTSSKTMSGKEAAECLNKKKNLTDYLQQKFQSQQKLPKKKEESQTAYESPATRKRKRMFELFGEDPLTPVKRTTGDHRHSHETKKPTDSNLQIEPQRGLTKRRENLAQKRQRMIELFGEDSDSD